MIIQPIRLYIILQKIILFKKEKLLTKQKQENTVYYHHNYNKKIICELQHIQLFYFKHLKLINTITVINTASGQNFSIKKYSHYLNFSLIKFYYHYKVKMRKTVFIYINVVFIQGCQTLGLELPLLSLL